MYPLMIVVSIFSICMLLIMIVHKITQKRFSNDLKKSQQIQAEAVESLAAKKAFIKSELGFDLYSYSTISKAFNKVTETYNTNVNSFVLYNHINSLKIPGGSSTEEALPVDTIYTLLKSITRRQELLFQYR